MSGTGPPSKRPRRSPGTASRSGSKTNRERDASQLTITSFLLRAAKKPLSAPPANSASSSSLRETPSKLGCSKHVALVEDMATKRIEATDRSSTSDCGERQRQREISPELFSDPLAAANDDGDYLMPDDNECVGASVGDIEEEAPANQDLIKVAKEGSSLSDKVTTACYLDESDDNKEDSSAPPVREKSPLISIATSSRSNTHSPEIDIPPWDGTPLSKINFGPSTYPILPPLQSSATHSVLFRPQLTPGKHPIPFPDKFKDVWDTNHVRMPCSSQSVYPVATPSGGGQRSAVGKTLVSRWDIIKESLRKPITNSYDLEEAIFAYNTHYAKRWNFHSLHSYFNDHCSEEESQSFFGSVLPRVIDLALSLPSLLTHAVPLLKKQLDYSVSLSQQQIACLLANAFLCTYPRRNARGVTSEYANYPSINFNTLFSGSAERGVSSVAANKLTCIFHYFTR